MRFQFSCISSIRRDAIISAPLTTVGGLLLTYCSFYATLFRRFRVSIRNRLMLSSGRVPHNLSMDFNRLTEKLQDSVRATQSKAVRYGHQQVDVEHLLRT